MFSLSLEATVRNLLPGDAPYMEYVCVFTLLVSTVHAYLDFRQLTALTDTTIPAVVSHLYTKKDVEAKSRYQIDRLKFGLVHGVYDRCVHTPAHHRRAPSSLTDTHRHSLARSPACSLSRCSSRDTIRGLGGLPAPSFPTPSGGKTPRSASRSYVLTSTDVRSHALTLSPPKRSFARSGSSCCRSCRRS